jgi:two-component system LytT family response regulator
MKNWQTIIVDDERLARYELREQLKEFSQINIVAEASDMHEAEKAINDCKPDLLFLDIDLGTHTGFDLLARINTGFKVVFITAHDEYAIRAFEVNALDYLLKPVWPDRLANCIRRLGDPHSEKLPENLNCHDQILVKMRSSSRFVKVNEITCIEACSDYTRLYSSKKISGLVHHTLKRWLDRLPSGEFIRVHKSFIVNVNFVDRIAKDIENGVSAILPYPEKPIPVSRRFGSKLFATFKP